VTERPAEVHVSELTVEEVRPLRRAVLRAGMQTQDVAWPGDDVAGTFHLGVVEGGEVIAVSTWIPSVLDGEPAVQIRGMATAPGNQGAGLGAALLAAGFARVAATGTSVIWANARDAAMAFYARNGFTAIDDGFIDETTSLPHHRVVRRLEAPGFSLPQRPSSGS
jgi:GNAT superfamily N-acetyltransferase